MDWTPLQDHWDEYEAHLESALEDGLLDDPTAAQELLYPPVLHLGEGEKDDVREFVSERLSELFTVYQNQGTFNIDLIGTYIFRAILMGMEWENERIGR
jgi:hypothetical protein